MLYKKESDELLIVKLSAAEVMISGILHPECFSKTEFCYVMASLLSEPINRTNFGSNVYVDVEQGDSDDYPVTLKVRKGKGNTDSEPHQLGEQICTDFSDPEDSGTITIPVKIHSAADIPRIMEEVWRSFDTSQWVWAVLQNGEEFFIVFVVNKEIYEQVLLFLFEFADKAEVAQLSKNEYMKVLEHGVDKSEFFLDLMDAMYES